MLKLKNYRSAFTIIEIVLVLAIAGLIFLMVFIALPALQRSQRNTNYKNNVGLMAAAVRGYQANNKGNLPTEVDLAMGNASGLVVGSSTNSAHPFHSYVQNSGVTNGTNIKVNRVGVSSSGSVTEAFNITYGRLLIYTNAKCTTPSVRATPGEIFYEAQIGSAIVWTILEQGDGLVYCQDI